MSFLSYSLLQTALPVKPIAKLSHSAIISRMERLKGDPNTYPLQPIEGHILDAYGDVKPEDLNSLRRQAFLFTAGREATIEELERITSTLHISLGDVHVTRDIFPNGSNEVFVGETGVFRMQYYRAEGTVFVRRGPNSPSPVQPAESIA